MGKKPKQNQNIFSNCPKYSAQKLLLRASSLTLFSILIFKFSVNLRFHIAGLTAILTVTETRLEDPNKVEEKQKDVQNSLPVLVSQPLVSKSLNQISDPSSDL